MLCISCCFFKYLFYIRHNWAFWIEVCCFHPFWKTVDLKFLAPLQSLLLGLPFVFLCVWNCLFCSWSVRVLPALCPVFHDESLVLSPSSVIFSFMASNLFLPPWCDFHTVFSSPHFPLLGSWCSCFLLCLWAYVHWQLLFLRTLLARLSSVSFLGLFLLAGFSPGYWWVPNAYWILDIVNVTLLGSHCICLYIVYWGLNWGPCLC